MKKGSGAKSGKFFEFFGAVRLTEATARVNYLNAIAKAANNGDWRAALEYLKRRDKATWGDTFEVTSFAVQVSADDMAAARAKAHEYEKGLLNDRPSE
jgi:hypothetical protein